MRYIIQAVGIKPIITKFNRTGVLAADAEPAMEEVGAALMAIQVQVFNSQGRRGGGSWKRDTPEWLASKMRLGLDPRINHATLALRRSLTERGADGQIMDIMPHSVRFGSSLPQAGPSQRNRPFMKLSLNDRALLRNIIKDYVMAAWREA